MNLDELIKDKTIKAKTRLAQVGDGLLFNEIQVDELLAYTASLSGAHKATCIEALEYAPKKNPALANENLLAFVTKTLSEEAPGIKWESAKVIGNIAGLFPKKLTRTVNALLQNADHEGTVVRWATAYALAAILKLKTAANKKILPKIEMLLETETDTAVRKKYLDALQRLKK